MRVCLLPHEPIYGLVIGRRQRLRLSVAIWTDRKDDPGPIEAVYVLE